MLESKLVAHRDAICEFKASWRVLNENAKDYVEYECVDHKDYKTMNTLVWNHCFTYVEEMPIIVFFNGSNWNSWADEFESNMLQGIS